MVRFIGDELNFVHNKNDRYCWHCGRMPAFANYVGFTDDTSARGAYEVDDSVPRAHGGTEYLCKLVPACVESNESKGDSVSSKFTGRGIR